MRTDRDFRLIPSLRKFRTAWELPGRDKLRLLCLFFLGAAARGALLALPFAKIAPLLGRRHGNVPLSPLVGETDLALACRIGALAGLAARYSPWECKCLAQALMVKTLLNRYRIPYALYLGVAKAAKGQGGSGGRLTAHAWVVVGSRVVSGAAECRGFSIVSTFVSPSILSGTGTESRERIPRSEPQSLSLALRK